MIAVVLWCCVGWAAPAPSVESTTDFAWVAPQGCPQRDAVEAQVVHWVGSPTMSAASIDGAIEAAETGYELSLEITADGRTERRELAADDCQLLGQTAALLVAITLDPVAAAAATEAPVDVAATGGLATSTRSGVAAAGETADGLVAPVADPVEASAPVGEFPAESQEGSVTEGAAPIVRERERSASSVGVAWRHGFDAAVSGGLGIGIVPAITGGVEADVGWRWGPIRARALGYHWFGRQTLDSTDRGVFAALSGAGLRGCYAVEAPRVDVPICGGFDLAALWGRGIGPGVEPRTPADLWVALAAGVGFELAIGRRFALQSRVELVATVRRPALHLDLGGIVDERFRAPPVGIRIMVGPSIRSPR